VDAENLTVDDGGKDEEIEHMTAGLPNRGVAVLLLTLFVESIHLGNLSRLVVTTNKHYSVRVSVEYG
jgi:hypothetical protein